MFKDYRKEKPLDPGWYIWRLPHKHLDNVVIVFLAKYRLRGAGWENVLSPEFDYWDGYRLHLPDGSIEWMQFDGEPPLTGREVIEIEGVELRPCPFCKKVPKWRYLGQWITSGPTNTKLWYTKCCGWASGIGQHFTSPIELNNHRNLALDK